MILLKRIVLILLILFVIAALVPLFMGGFMPLFSIAFGFLFLYYLCLYILLRIVAKRNRKVLIYIFYMLLAAPLLWIVLDWESLFNFLLQGVKLDMK